MQRVLVTGGAGTTARPSSGGSSRPVVRGARLRPARRRRSGCARAARSTGRPAPARRGAEAVDGCTHVIHLAGDRRWDRELPQAAADAARRSTARSTTPWCGRRSRPRASSASSTSRRAWCSSRRRSTRPRRSTSGPARSPLGLRLLQAAGRGPRAGRDDEFGLPWTICRPFNAYGPGELPEDEPGIAHMVPDVIRKVLTWRPGARSRSSATGPRRAPSRTSTTSPTGSSPAMGSPAALREDFNISAARR
jgi:nucleoside-diphosphate-sugar epimerase